LNIELIPSQTVTFARRYYGETPSFYGKTLVQHAVSVSRLAENIGRKLYQDVRADFASEETLENVAVMVHSAILHDVINVGRCAFEHIAERTTVQVAAAVADLSRDYRLVETKRDMEYRGRLSQSPVSTQIVAVADVICTASEIHAMVSDLGLESVSRARKMLMQLDGDLLAITAASRFYTLRLYTHAARNKLSDVSQLIKDCKSKARMDRQVSAATSGLRIKAAAKVSKATETQAENADKEPKHGTKRTTRRDS
jgi:hypothetical protein